MFASLKFCHDDCPHDQQPLASALDLTCQDADLAARTVLPGHHEGVTLTDFQAPICVGPDANPDKYRLIRQVGQGGEAQLWYAEMDVAGGAEPVAVKILRTDRMGEFDQVRVRWGEQSELLRFITHPGVVTVREHFDGSPMHRAGEHTDAGRALYLVMNWVEGDTLRDWVPLHLDPAGVLTGLGYLAQIATVLDWLHSGQATPSNRPVIHGDVSPANILLTRSGQAVLVDFGLVRMASHQTVQPFLSPGYAAPETWNGEYSAAADRYSFGAVTYLLLAGTEPPKSYDAIRAGLAAVPLIAALGDEVLEPLMAIFDPEPNNRPLLVDWIRLLRSASTTSAAATVRKTLGASAGAAATLPIAAAVDRRPRRAKRVLFVAAAVAVLLAAGGTAFALSGTHRPASKNTAATQPLTSTSTSPTPTPTPTPTPSPSSSPTSAPPSSSAPVSSPTDGLSSQPASALPLTAGSAASSPPPPATTHITWSFTKSQGDAGQPLALTYTATGLDPGTQLVLQRQVGTDLVWTTVAPLADGKGQGPAIGIGAYNFRVAAVDSSAVVAASDPTTLQVFGDVPLSTLLGKSTSTATIGTHVFRYSDETGNLSGHTATNPRTLFSVLSTCRAATFQLAVSGNGWGPAVVAVSQERADAKSTTVQPTSITSLSVALVPDTTFSLIAWPQAGRDSDVYYDGVVSCYTPTGQQPQSTG